MLTVDEVLRGEDGARTRTLYALRGDRPVWRAPLGAELRARLEAGA